MSSNLLKGRLPVQGHQRIIFSELQRICSLLILKKGVGWEEEKNQTQCPCEEKKQLHLLADNHIVSKLHRKTFTESYIPRLRRIVFLINYPLITDRLIRDKYQRRPIPLGHVQYAPRAAIFVDLFGSKLASPILLPLPESPGCAR